MADKALILGINQYKSVSGLRGCENDAKNIQALLVDTFGFASDRVRIHLNDAVLKSKVRAEMNWLLEGAEPGDRVFLHFSGHGSYVADTDGDEDDAVDELICLHDMDFKRRSSYFTDDDLRAWTKRLPEGVFLVVSLDSCHSGTGTRKLIPASKTRDSVGYERVIEAATASRLASRVVATRGAGGMSPDQATALAQASFDPPEEAKVIARFVDPPPEVVARVAGFRSRAPRKIKPMSQVAASMNHVLLAACDAEQTAADAYIGGTYQGAFTSSLCQILRDAGRMLDRAELNDRLVRAMKAGGYSQVPRVESSRPHGPVFGAGTEVAEGAKAPEVSTPPPGVVLDPKTGIPDPMPELTGNPQGPGTGAAPKSAEEGADLYRELLATFNRLVDLIQPGAGVALGQGAGRAVTDHHIVYVHGIGSHPKGFSTRWWSAMAPYTPSLKPGDLGVNRHEAYWSDLVNSIRAASAGQTEVAEAIRRTLEERIDREAMVASAAAASSRDLETADRSAELAQARGSLSSLGGIDDFTTYLMDRSLRDRVIGRFREAVVPLLEAGDRVEIISHSWGTVVAYEGLRLLETDPIFPRLKGRVRNFFTVGSALSIGEIQRRLLPEASGGNKPKLVDSWWNLTATGDPVGGRLDRVFKVDREFSGLPATGCGTWMWILPDPVCAHSSYFDVNNGTVNQGIFAKLIERGAAG